MKYIKIIPHFFFQLAMTLLWLITFLLVQKLDRTRLLSVDIYSTYLSNSDLWSLKMKQQNCWAHLLQIHGFFMQILNGHVLLTSARVPSLGNLNRWADIFTIQCRKKTQSMFICVLIQSESSVGFHLLPLCSSLLTSHHCRLTNQTESSWV